MRIALDMFGQHDVTTLGDIVQNIDEYDDESFIYVSSSKAFGPDAPALVVDESSERDWHVVQELELIEHTEVYWAKEIIRGRLNSRVANAPTIADLVRAIEIV